MDRQPPRRLLHRLLAEAEESLLLGLSSGALGSLSRGLAASLLRGGLLWKKGPMEQVLTEEHLSATFGLELHLERKNDRYQWYPVS